MKLKDLKSEQIDGMFDGLIFEQPLQIKWVPKKDITTYELALCLPYLFGTSIMSSAIDRTLKHFRHFEITDPN